VRALLDRGRNRAPLTRGVAVALAAMACAAILPMAAITSYAQDARGAIAGVVTDPSGARVPGAAVLAKNLDGGNEESAKTNAAGEFVFRSIPAGRYEVQFRVPGFKMDKVQATVTPGSAAEASAALELGEVSEAVTVTGARGPAARPAPAAGQAAPRRIAVGGNVQPVRLVRHTRPVYPEELKQAGITGVVMIRAIVGKDGQLLNPRVVNTDVDPGLAKAALDAVSEWLYEPARLNGQAVETVTSIAIRYELEQ